MKIKCNEQFYIFFRMIPEKYRNIKNQKYTFLTIITNEQDVTAT